MVLVMGRDLKRRDAEIEPQFSIVDASRIPRRGGPA